jgi:hypothetical protein
VLYDGARMSYQMDQDPRSARFARDIAEQLMDAATVQPVR